MPGKNDTYFRHLKPGEKDYKRSDSGGLYLLVTTAGSKLWRYSYRFDAKQKLLAIGQYPVISHRRPHQARQCREIAGRRD